MPAVSGMSILSMGAIGAGVAALTAGWSQMKGFWERLIGLVMVTTKIEGRIALGARYYCDTTMKRAWTPFRFFRGEINYVRSRARWQTVVYETLGDKVALHWHGYYPVWVTTQGDTVVTFRFLRGTIDPTNLVLAISDEWTKAELRTGTRFSVRRISGKSGKDLFGMGQSKTPGGKSGEQDEPSRSLTTASAGTFRWYEGKVLGFDESDIGEGVSTKSPLARISTTPEIDNAIAEVKRWFESREWYTDRQIPWRRGILLTGQPGTGKSSLAKAMAQDMDLPIYLLDVATMDNQEFHSAWKQALSSAPAMVLLEDIDSVFEGRKNLVAEKGQGLSFDCMLNTISGVESSDGILLVVTSNHPENLDPALGVPVDGSEVSTRPGRIDRVVHMNLLDEAGREKMAKRILHGCPDHMLQTLLHAGVGDTGAQFEDRCAQAALRSFWGVPSTGSAATQGVVGPEPQIRLTCVSPEP